MGALGDFHLRFWGVRGSIPAPGAHTSRYGGNTPCIEVRCGKEQLIFDLGTGVRELGEHQRGPFRSSVFVSHYHYDHLQGLPFFTPMFDARSRFTVYGPSRGGLGVEELLAGQMQQPYFPVTPQMVFRARVDYRGIAGGETVKVGAVKVTAIELNHPGGNLGYRVDYRGRSLVYATDTEHGSPADHRLAEAARGTQVLVYDAMYTEQEYSGRKGSSKKGWGHSTWQGAVAEANLAQAERLVLFHHAPARDDSELDQLLRQVRKHRPEAIAAREGLVLAL